MNEADTGGLSRRAVGGFLFSTGAQITRVLIQFASVVILGRMLTPHDYGVVAMVTAITGVAELFRDMGLNVAAIQAKTLSVAQRNNLWWINTAMGAFLMVLIAASGPLLVRLYGAPEVLMVTLVLAPGFLFSAMQTQYRANLTRELRFKVVASNDMAMTILTIGLSILFASMGFGYWSLVLPNLIANIVGLGVYVWIARWLPGRFTRGVGTKAFLKLGWRMLVSTLLFYTSRNLDSVLVGRFFGSESLGFYNRANQLVKMPVKLLQGPAASVLMPTMARFQDDDEKLRRAMRLMQAGMGYPIVFFVALFVVLPKELVWLTIGPQWLPMAELASWVAIGAGVSVITSTIPQVLVAKGMGNSMIVLNIVSAIGVVLAVVVGVRWGVEGVAAALAVAFLLQWPIPFLILQKTADMDVSTVMWSGLRIVCAAVLASAASFGVIKLLPHGLELGPVLLRLGSACLVVVLVLLALALVPTYRRDYREVLDVVAGFRKPRG